MFLRLLIPQELDGEDSLPRTLFGGVVGFMEKAKCSVDF